MTGKPDYNRYIEYLESIGWIKEHITLNELEMTMVKTYSVGKFNTGAVIDIRCPAGRKMSIMGEKQIPEEDFLKYGMSVAYALRMTLADINGIELDPRTKIRITKESCC